MPTYTVRRATLDDADVLVRHRVRMFEDMGVLPPAAPAAGDFRESFRAWLADVIPRGVYVAWVVDAVEAGRAPEVVAGGGATIIPWPPGPRYPGTTLAFVYNVFTEEPHRGRGLGRRVMEAIHTFCRDHGIRSVALNASADGRPLYASMGYQVTSSPMMFLSLD